MSKLTSDQELQVIIPSVRGHVYIYITTNGEKEYILNHGNDDGEVASLIIYNENSDAIWIEFEENVPDIKVVKKSR